jgi:hypothetical protein
MVPDFIWMLSAPAPNKTLPASVPVPPLSKRNVLLPPVSVSPPGEVLSLQVKTSLTAVGTKLQAALAPLACIKSAAAEADVRRACRARLRSAWCRLAKFKEQLFIVTSAVFRDPDALRAENYSDCLCLRVNTNFRTTQPIKNIGFFAIFAMRRPS